MASGKQDVRDNLRMLGTIAAEAKNHLCAGARADSIGKLADSAMEGLRALGLSDPWLEALLSEGKRSGALGGKLSGAGGGGAFFLVCAGELAAQETAMALGEAADNYAIKLVAGPRALRVGG